MRVLSTLSQFHSETLFARMRTVKAWDGKTNGELLYIAAGLNSMFSR